MDHEPTPELELPGFRFHPTEEELFNFYLKSIVFGKKMHGDVIGFLNIYNHHPMELPGLAKIGEREWYFFVTRDKKHGSGGRPNRTTEHGFWKATGSDRKIPSMSVGPNMMLGLKKTLVFYEGRAPRGKKTDWIMNEYRLPDTNTLPTRGKKTDWLMNEYRLPDTNTLPKDIVLCKIYRKATSLKVLEQRVAMDSISFSNQFEEVNMTTSESCNNNYMGFKKENDKVIKLVEESCNKEKKCTSSLKLPNGRNGVDIQLPKVNMDWTQDSFWSQLSPWLENSFALGKCS